MILKSVNIAFNIKPKWVIFTHADGAWFYAGAGGCDALDGAWFRAGGCVVLDGT